MGILPGIRSFSSHKPGIEALPADTLKVREVSRHDRPAYRGGVVVPWCQQLEGVYTE